MATKTVVVSDLTGEIIPNESHVSLVVHDHSELDHAVRLDASSEELKALKDLKGEFVLIEVKTADGDERHVLKAADFNKLFTTDVAETLAEAEHYSYGSKAPEEPKKRAKVAPAPAKGPKVDYKTIENAGRVHRGRITDEEKLQVQQNLDKVNANLKKLGEREIDLSSADMVEKYGLHKLAQERGIIPK